MPTPGTFDDWKKTIPHRNQYPVITNVVATQGSGGADSAVVTWTTDVASTSQVRYGARPYQNPLPQESGYDSSSVTSHSVALSGLMGGELYYISVESRYLDSLSKSPIQSIGFSLSGWDYWGEVGMYWGKAGT